MRLYVTRTVLTRRAVIIVPVTRDIVCQQQIKGPVMVSGTHCHLIACIFRSHFFTFVGIKLASALTSIRQHYVTVFPGGSTEFIKSKTYENYTYELQMLCLQLTTDNFPLKNSDCGKKPVRAVK